MKDEVFYLLALHCLPDLGAVSARRIIRHLGSAKAFFQKNVEQPLPLPPTRIQHWRKHIDTACKRAEQEAAFLERENVELLTEASDAYPKRLRHCPDAPLLLFKKGSTTLNPPRTLAIVGTRKYTHYGKDFVFDIMQDLATVEGLHIISGLADGIDGFAHTAACENNMINTAVFGTGLKKVYPAKHRRLAQRILDSGGHLLSEYPSVMEAFKHNFPRRNRVIAGMADGVLVVESNEKGGAMITADIALGYHREVLALPGRYLDPSSRGCNTLIKTMRAQAVESSKDIVEAMNWDGKTQGVKQRSLFVENLTEAQEQIIETLRTEGIIAFEWLRLHTGLTTGGLSAELIDLEMQGHIRQLPGNRYSLV